MMMKSDRVQQAKQVCLAALVVAAVLGAAAADTVNLRPWEGTRRTLKADGQIARPDLMDLVWRSNGSEGKIAVVAAESGAGKMLDWRIDIDHHSAGAYPVGWPSFEALPRPMKDFSGRGTISFKMRALGDIGRPQVVRFILKHGEGKMVNVPLPGLQPRDGWREMTIDIGDAAWLKEVDRIHFFICEEEYRHGEKLNFQIKDFRLGTLVTEPVPLAAGCAGATLWVGDRADRDSRAVLLDEGTTKLPAVLHIENRLDRAIPAEAEVRFRLRDVFTDKETVRTMRLGTTVAPGARARVALACDLAGLVPDYYHVLADILVDGASVLGTRKGSDDFYIRRRGESMTASMLALRLGMAYWVMDRLHGGFIHSTDIALPHCYDPYDTSLAAYGEFLKRFAHMTSKVCEGYEAGMPGLALAAEAYRKTGDAVRCAFAEKLLWNSCEAMLTMQDVCGGVLTAVNELRDDGIGFGWGGGSRNSVYSADQTAEWMRGLTYATFYYLRRGGAADKIAKLNAACAKAGRFLVANCVEEQDGVSRVIHNYSLACGANGKIRRNIYRQEGRQCDVYQPRIVAGLSYTALALLKSGETVPEDWWGVFDDSAKWMTQKMKGNGWFDWQCADVVEGGCHTFLGNIYLGEGLFGVVLADRAAGRVAEAARVLPAARLAYRYVTDDCWIRGRRYQYPLEFWVGPYVYWLFVEWERHVGPEPAFRDWIETLDRKWSVERAWGDFMRMPGMDCGRAKGNGMLTIAILGSLAIRYMDEAGHRWTLVDGLSPADRTPPDLFSVMTWNTMHYGWEQQPAGQGAARERVMCDQIRDSGVDVVLIQETYGSFDRLLKGLPGWHGALLGACNCVLSRHPIVKTYEPYDDGLLYGTTTGYDYKNKTAPFTVAVAELDVKGRRVRVAPIAMNWQPYCTQFPANLTPEQALAWERAPQSNKGRPRPQAMRMILESMADLCAEADRIPLVIGGDFNSQSHLDWTAATGSVANHHGRVIPWDVSRIMAEAGFVDTFRAIHPDPAKTYGNSFGWLQPGNVASATTLRLDYIYALGTALQAVASETCTQPYLKPYAWKGTKYPIFPSDHGFVVTTFAWK